jgi:thioredoxin-related protein
MRSALIIIICAPLFLQAQVVSTNEKMLDNPVTSNLQSESSGIKWIEDLNWQQIRNKAKKENKYIFVDCYATWCGPCKKMDQDVFSKKDVGAFFKDKFIAVKIQMDSTRKDPDFVKAWYKGAAMFEKKYFVFAYPTQLFFNPQGELVEKSTGFEEEHSFMNITRASLKPGKKYEDPYKEFLVLKDKYQKGKKDYQQFPYMISMAKKNEQSEFAQKLIDELHLHLLTLSNVELQNRNYIEFINEYENVSNKNSGNNLSRIFFADGKKVDALMERKNYSMNALNGMIRRGYVIKFINRFTGAELKKSERDSMGLNANVSIPWDSLYSDIAKQFTMEIAEQNILWSKTWYFDFYGDPRALKYFIELTKKYGTEALNIDPQAKGFYINYIAWFYCRKPESDLNDTRYISELLKKAIENVIEQGKTNLTCHPYQLIDTYARLLDKLGEKEKAIKNQMEAIDIYLNCGGGTRGDEVHQDMLKQLSKMQNGQANFSGKWMLNLDKTQFNETPGKPAATNLLVEQKADSITFQRNDHPKESLKIDSTAFIEIREAETKTKVSIKPTPDKQGLIETRVYTYPEGITSVVAAKKTRTWTLSADKKTLTIQDHIETTAKDRNYDMLLIYDRQ